MEALYIVRKRTKILVTQLFKTIAERGELLLEHLVPGAAAEAAL
jgi:hypothetical protein